MTKLRILIVDDEPLARDRMRALLSTDPALEIVGEASNGDDALAAIQDLQPELVFLDMQMPGCDGLEVVRRLADPRPAIVFVTAHERFAVEAFATEASDYLLKPFDRARLQLALKRVRDSIAARRERDLGSRLESLLASRPSDPERIAVRADGRVVFLKHSDIVWIEAANNYCVLHLADQKRFMLRETLSSLEARFSSSGFARVNRSALVHLNRVRELQSAAYGDYIVVLDTGQRLPLSRNFRGRLEHFLPEPL
jgi:Response regulator of the LytR/AlgR family